MTSRKHVTQIHNQSLLSNVSDMEKQALSFLKATPQPIEQQKWPHYEFTIDIMINISDTVVGFCRINVLASANAINYNGIEYSSIMDILSNQKIFTDYCNEKSAPRSVDHSAKLPAFRHCWWWLRTPSKGNEFACTVTPYGVFDPNSSSIRSTSVMVRPAMWVRYAKTYAIRALS